jgi:hypothetical protein
MIPTAKRGSLSLKKLTLTKARIDEEQENSEIIIRLNRKRPFTRREFVIYTLESAGKRGLFVNELLRGWNNYRDELGKPRSNYATFRKLVWGMKKDGIIEWVPDGKEVPRKDREGEEMFAPSYYRLTRKYLKSRY